jgi:hypothetical protein
MLIFGGEENVLLSMLQRPNPRLEKDLRPARNSSPALALA